MVYISTTVAYPASTDSYQKVLSEENLNDDNQIHAVNPADIKHDSANNSSLQLSIKHEHDRKERQVLGCQMGTEMKPCGSLMVVTVKCRKQSVTCIGRGVVSPTCIPQKTYYQECGKAFLTACLCKS